MRKIEDVFTVERAVAAFAPEKNRTPVQGRWIQAPEKDGDGAGKPACLCLASAILLDEAAERTAVGRPTIPFPPDIATMAAALDLPLKPFGEVVAGWDGKYGSANDSSGAGDLGRACWEAVQKARRQLPPAG